MRESVQCNAMIKTFFSFLIIASLVVCLYVAPASAQDKSLPQADFAELKQTGTSAVLQVIDPHTIQLEDGRLIRLTGIDFPDYKTHEPGDVSLTAVKILRDMLEGQSVNTHQTKKKDSGRLNRMGHHIAHLERKDDGAWIQGSLVSLGLARVRTTKRNPEMAAALYALETKARAEKLGLWAAEGFGILMPEDTENHIGSFQIVEGTIESAALRKNRIYLNFGKNWRDDFTVSIAPTDKRSFTKEGLDPLQWNGKTIRVRGWLESYNGAYMEINHPRAVEITARNPAEKAAEDQTLPEPPEPPMVRTIEPNP